ncbi:MAG TPA: FtsX-like permease family protein [Candidatus Angelobacter sp.]|nr:FtsX-like permease family protein [Candidatus Angelobacter sp.]
MIGPLGFATRSLQRRGFHSYLAFLGLTLTVATTTFLLLLGQALASRLGVDSSTRSTFGISWLIFAYLVLALGLISIVGLLSTSYLVSSMISQRMRDIGVIKAAGALPRRLLAYVTFEAIVVIVSSCFVGGLMALLIYSSWSWPSVSLFKQVGPIANAGATILIIVPLISFLLSYIVASFRVRRIVGSTSSVNAISKQLSSLDLKSLGKPLRIKRLGSAFNLATRNVSRDRGFNRTLLSVGICICLSMIVLSGALVSADTSASYVVRAMPSNVLIVANSNVYDQYVSLATSFSRTASISSIDYTNASYIIAPQNASAFRSIPGVEIVDTRLITMSPIIGFVKAHFASNQDTGENINTQIIPEVDTGTAQALIVGINATSAIGDWYTSDGFLQSSDAQYTMIAGDSLVGNIVQMPFNLSQVSAFGYRYDIKSAAVDPINAGRVLYAPVHTVQRNLAVNGYNVLLLKASRDPSVLLAVSKLASSLGLVVGSQDPILNSNLAFLNSTWSYIFLIPIMVLALTCGILLSYFSTNFSRRFNDYVVLKILGANVWYRLKLLLWESWGVLAISMAIAIPIAWAFAIFFLVPDPSLSIGDLELSTVVAVSALSVVPLASAVIYSTRLGSTTVKDLKA